MKGRREQQIEVILSNSKMTIFPTLFNDVQTWANLKVGTPWLIEKKMSSNVVPLLSNSFDASQVELGPNDAIALADRAAGVHNDGTTPRDSRVCFVYSKK